MHSEHVQDATTYKAEKHIKYLAGLLRIQDGNLCLLFYHLWEYIIQIFLGDKIINKTYDITIFISLNFLNID